MSSKALYDAMVELQVLNYVFQKNSMQFVILNGITEEHFTTYKEQFKFLKNFYAEYNQLPSRETFQTKFSDDFEWLTVTDPEEYLLEKLEEAKLYRNLIDDYKVFTNLIKNQESDKAVEKMAEISQKYMKQKQSKCVDLIGDIQQRFDTYVERVENPEEYGVTTGLKELDEILGGWDMKNETAIIAGRPGFGKSWWLIYFALAAAKQGLRVGFYSGEMETDLVGYRLDTFLGNIANGSLTHGNRNILNQYKDYADYITQLVPGNIFCITPDMIGGSATVSKLRAFVEKYDLQMLCVDQFSLLEDERRGRTPREQMSNLSKDLRTLQRLKKIPILAASQLNREESEDGPSTKNISESDRIGQDATTVLFIERKDNNVTLTVGKARNARTGDKLTYAWNINMGILHYIPTEKDARQGEGTAEIIQQYSDMDKSSSVF